MAAAADYGLIVGCSVMSVQNENATLLNVTALEAVVWCRGCLKDQWMFTTVVLNRFLSPCTSAWFLHMVCNWFVDQP